MCVCGPWSDLCIALRPPLFGKFRSTSTRHVLHVFGHSSERSKSEGKYSSTGRRIVSTFRTKLVMSSAKTAVRRASVRPRVASCMRAHVLLVCVFSVFSLEALGTLIGLHEPLRSESRNKRRHLHCSTPQQLVKGEWVVDEKRGITRWEPRDCSTLFYDTEATHQLISSNEVAFVGVDSAHWLVDKICTLSDVCSGFWAREISSKDVAKAQLIAEKLIESRTRVISLVWESVDQSSFVAVHTFVSSLRRSGFSGRIIFATNLRHRVTRNGAILMTRLTDLATELMDFSELIQTHAYAQQVVCFYARIKWARGKPSYLPPGQRCHTLAKTQLEAVIVQLMLNAIEDLQTRGFQKFDNCGTCALVSSAGYLLKAEYGTSIDEADFVVRSSASPVNGYERFVGSRTDLRILRHSVFDGTRGYYEPDESDHIVVLHDKIPNTTAPLWQYKNQWALTKRLVPFLNVVRPVKWSGSTSRLLQCLSQQRDVSTGTWTIYFLIDELDFCCTVKLYGFRGFQFPDEPYHYYTLRGEQETMTKSTRAHYASRKRLKGGHDFRLEQSCIDRMMTDGIIESID